MRVVVADLEVGAAEGAVIAFDGAGAGEGIDGVDGDAAVGVVLEPDFDALTVEDAAGAGVGLAAAGVLRAGEGDDYVAVLMGEGAAAAAAHLPQFAGADGIVVQLPQLADEVGVVKGVEVLGFLEPAGSPGFRIGRRENLIEEGFVAGQVLFQVDDQFGVAVGPADVGRFGVRAGQAPAAGQAEQQADDADDEVGSAQRGGTMGG